MYDQINKIIEISNIDPFPRLSKEGSGVVAFEYIPLYIYCPKTENKEGLYVLSQLGQIRDIKDEAKIFVQKELLKINLPRDLYRNYRISIDDDDNVWFSYNFSMQEIESSDFANIVRDYKENALKFYSRVREIISNSLTMNATNTQTDDDDDIDVDETSTSPQENEDGLITPSMMRNLWG